MSQQPFDPSTPGVPAWNQPAPAVVPPRRPWFRKKRFIIPAALVGLLMLPGIVGGGNRTPTGTAVPAASPSVAASSVAATSVAATTVPAPTTKAPEPVRTTAAPVAPHEFDAISARDFKLLAKDPDAYTGKGYTIYGYVSQFDSATGSEGFRANTGATKVKASDWYKLEQNSILSGDKAMLSEVVEDDLFVAKVVVVGSYSYDTQIGGRTTVPAFAIHEISVYGSKE